MQQHICEPDETIEDPIERLKALADCYWHDGKPDNAFEIGQRIIQQGEANGVFSHQGLGYMVCGDARNDQHRYAEAWDLLQEASRRYEAAEQAGEPDAAFHRARTAIGKLPAAIGADKSALAQQEFEIAKTIFLNSTRTERLEKLASLHHNFGIFQWRLGQFSAARKAYDYVLSLIYSGQVKRFDLEPAIYMAIGSNYAHQGAAREAIEWFQKALTLCLNNPRLTESIFLVQQHLAIAEMNQGLYQECLNRLQTEILDKPNASPRIRLGAQRTMLACLLMLNNFVGAVDLAERLINSPEQVEETDQRGPALAFLATAHAELEMYRQAEDEFGQALDIFERGDFAPQIALARLRRAQVRLQRGDLASAHEEASSILDYFIRTGHQSQEAETRLVLAQIAHINGESAVTIANECREVLHIAEECDAFQHRYGTTVLLAHSLLRLGSTESAEDFYWQALNGIDYVQQRLAMTFRSGFLADKGEALRSLVHLYLESGCPDKAFYTIERSRAQVFLRYLTINRPLQQDSGSADQQLKEQLQRLRQDYVSYSNAASVDLVPEHDLTHETLIEVRRTARERTKAFGEKIRDLTRRLYGYDSSPAAEDSTEAIDLATLQRAVGMDKCLIAYYDDGQQIVAFIIDSTGIKSRILGKTTDVRAQIKKVDVNVAHALGALRLVRKADAELRGDALLRLPPFNQPTMNRAFERASAALYDILIRPLEAQLGRSTTRLLMIVPYGLLHFVPFHLLFDKVRGNYLSQIQEVITLPTASLLGRPTQTFPNQAVIIYDTLNGTLAHPERDAQSIQEILKRMGLNTTLYSSREALSSGVLENSEGQILHIIAHAQFNELHPELSFIQLDGNPLLMSDLLGRTLRYKLVVLTACETGRLNLVERGTRGLLGDDLVGLGRAFLYAGAQTVMASRWLVGDGMTLPLLERFYAAVGPGIDIAEALRGAQASLTDAKYGIPNLHPAFWGVFQVIGQNSHITPFSK